jgi:hypothetical protein
LHSEKGLTGVESSLNLLIGLLFQKPTER